MHYYYLLIFILLVIFAFLESVVVQKNVRLSMLLLAFFLLFFTSAFKYETGIDWYIYGDMFKDTPSLSGLYNEGGLKSIWETMDPGYNFLVSSVKFFGGSLQTVFFIMAVFTSVILWKSLSLYSPYPLVSLLLYYTIIFFVMDMSGIRQALTLVIFFYSLQFIHQRNITKYFLTIFVAFLFHWSALFLLPLYFFIHKKYNLWILVGIVAVGVIVFLSATHWLDSIILSTIPLVDDKEVLGKFAAYTTTEKFAGGRVMNNDSIIKMISMIFILLLLIWKRKALRERYDYFDLFLNLFIIQVIIFFALSQFKEVADRMNFYFLLPNIVLLPLFLDLLPRRLEKPIVFSGIFLYAMFYARAYLFEMQSVLPYTPYQNYLIYKAMDYESTGMHRLYIFAKSVESPD